jgi:hypothetical protein
MSGEGKDLILLVAAFSAMFVILSIFVFITTPRAELRVRVEDTMLILFHEGGSDLLWSELRVSVTKGRNSKPFFVDPTSPDYHLGPHGSLSAEDGDDRFVVGESVRITYSSDGSELEDGNWYRIIVKHKPTNTVIVDRQIEIGGAYA